MTGSSKNFSYTGKDIVQALRELGVENGDVVFSHSNIAFCGLPFADASPEDVAQVFIDAFLEVLGSTGVFVVPAFTYSFPENSVYDPASSISSCGFFAEYVRRHPAARRSLDPCVSVSAIGRRSCLFIDDLPENAYDENSFFGRFYKAGGKICNINFDAASTFIHYVERCHNTPYRFDKTFSGTICRKGICREARSTLWVRHLEEGTQPDFRLFHRYACEKNLFKSRRIGRGNIGVISARGTYDLISERLAREPLFLTRAGYMDEGGITRQ